jgi:hypothetical protein
MMPHALNPALEVDASMRDAHAQILSDIEAMYVKLDKEDGKHIYIWGPACGGKSVLVEYLIRGRDPSLPVVRRGHCTLAREILVFIEGPAQSIVESNVPPPFGDHPDVLVVYVPVIIYHEKQ